MSLLNMVEAKLPPGFRFHPRDDELICDYLGMKWTGGFNSSSMLVDVDLNKCEPWDLPATASVGNKEWYFFSLRDRKYATGHRTNRATFSGYWKATGKDRSVARKGVIVGMRKTLVFYRGRAPKGNKTEWIMHEYRMQNTTTNANDDATNLLVFHAKEDWVLCKVFYKNRGISTKSKMVRRSQGDEENKEEDDDDNDNANDINETQSLPPLLDNYITIEQAPSSQNMQVPCFSNTLDQSCPTTLPINHFQALSGMNAGWDQLSCDKEVLRTVLDQLMTAKMEPNGNLAQGCLGAQLPSRWNTF